MIENFSVPLPSSDNMTCGVDKDDVKVGLASAALHYQLNPTQGQNVASIELPQESRLIPGNGTLRLWVKGDASTNVLRLVLRHADVSQHPQLGRQVNNHRDLQLDTIPLDFDSWKEISLPVKGIPAGRLIWLSTILIGKNSDRTNGVVLLDGLRLYPANGTAPTVAGLCLAGPSVRSFETNVSVFLDAQHFGADPIKVQTHLVMRDKNDNLVVERDFSMKVAPNESREMELSLDPDNLQTFLPPFRIKGDLFSPDLPNLTATLDQTLVMGNSYLLFDDFSDVFGRWFTSGMALDEGRGQGLYGEQQHAYAGTQTHTAISRVEIDRSKLPPADSPPGRYAMKVDFVGDATVFNGIHRYLPGDAYRMGVWVCGDGSGAALTAIILDFAAAGSTFYTWNRSRGDRPVCRLDFQGWRYFEVDLPGNGIGPRTLRGGTTALDFPLDLSAFTIAPAAGRTNGTVLIGPVFLQTQQDQAESLSVQVAYDDPNLLYAPALGAWATVQNGSRVVSRKVRTSWTLLDRSDDVVAKGTEMVELKPMEARVMRIDLAGQAAAAATRVGPLRLQVTASDLSGSASAEEQIVISKPDSVALAADFESDRSYPRLESAGVGPEPGGPESLPKTTTAQKHSGERSLALPWKAGAFSLASIAPPLDGIPTSISLWIFGDASGALFYPLIGSQMGVISGADQCQWNLFLPRTAEGPLQNAVAVDWNGWKQVTFLLPPVPSTWNEASQIPAFVPAYPLGVHLVVLPPAGATTSGVGTVYVDDVTVRTHLEPAARLSLSLNRLSESNLRLPGSDISVTIANRQQTGPQAAPRKVTVSGRLFDWHAVRVAGSDTPIDLPPGETRVVTIAKGIPAGAYSLDVSLKEGATSIVSLAEDLLVADVSTLLGEQWPKALSDPVKLRAPLDDRFAFVEHDWDWAEFQPGNLQIETLLGCARMARKEGQDPYMLLGYSTYWSAASGLEELLADQLSNRNPYGAGGRDWGHATDTFHVPVRLDDWENYVYGLMRTAGRDVSGWILWNTPDGQSSLGVAPDYFAKMIALTDKWRRRYCPKTPLILGGLSRDTALPYLADLAKEGALTDFDGVNLRLDAGVISPEDNRIPEFIGELQAALDTTNGAKKTVLITDLDWAVEKKETGLNVFDQAAFLARAALLLNRQGANPSLVLQNPQASRLGFGLLYRASLSAPPLSQPLPTLQFKPAWWGMVRTKQFLRTVRNATEIPVQDTIPGKTRCVLYEQTSDGSPVAVVWRNNEEGSVSFEGTGLSPVSAVDLFSSPAACSNGWYGIGKIPTFFALKPSAAETPASALSRLQVRDAGRDPVWPQQVLASFTPSDGVRQKYAQTGGEETKPTGYTLAGTRETLRCLVFTNGGTEHFEVGLPKGAGLVIRKRYLLDDKGQTSEVVVNGKSRGTWNLRHAEDRQMSGGFRESCFTIPGRDLADATACTVDIRYTNRANTVGWTLFTYGGGEFPLSAVGAVHGDSGVVQTRIARNVVGLPLQIGKKRFDNGYGCFAPSLQEYALNKQYKKFTADVGVDAATEGKGSVVFEIYGDGKKLWASPIMSGLDVAKHVEVSVEGVDRLRLVVTDAGDGNRFDAADWCNAALSGL
jgi:hypothetical protein